MNYHLGPRYQRGRGLGSIFSALFRGLAPVARLGIRAGKSLIANPLVRQLGQNAFDAAKASARNVAMDVIEGKNLKDSVQQELEKARNKISTTLRGGRKRKHHKSAFKPSKKKKKFYSLLN